jgi:hypothetical protein
VLSDVAQGDVSRALRRIGDDEPVGLSLEKAFGGKVAVKVHHRERLGREFRKMFRAAGR